MPEVTASSIVDVRLGAQMVGALMVGTEEIYARFQKYSYNTPGDFSLTLPDWVSAYGVIMSGAGGGGRAGNGGNNAIGYGGKGGRLNWVSGTLTTSADRVLKGFIGAGGLGGTSSHANGQNGGNTSFISHDSIGFIAEGGTAYPSTGKQDGDTSSIKFFTPFYSYINLDPDSIYRNGPAGTGSGKGGTRGGGGAGGNGGIFGGYTYGGKGGDGFVDIYVWGMPRY